MNTLCICRLGGGPDDAKEIMLHPFFVGMNWQELIEKKVRMTLKTVFTSRHYILYFFTIFF